MQEILSFCGPLFISFFGLLVKRWFLRKLKVFFAFPLQAKSTIRKCWERSGGLIRLDGVDDSLVQVEANCVLASPNCGLRLVERVQK